MPSPFQRLAWLLVALPCLAGCVLPASESEINAELADIAGDLMDGLDQAVFYSFSSRRSDVSRDICEMSSVGTCTNNVRVLDFTHCKFGTGIFTGAVTLTYADAAQDNTCAIDAGNQTITRKQSWTITGPRDWSVEANSIGSVGESLQWLALDHGKYSSDGYRRTATNLDADVVSDFTLRTTEDLDVQLAAGGDARNGRVVDGGRLRIENNLTGNLCLITAHALTWDNSCTCAVSGTLTGSCSAGADYRLTVKSCGRADITANNVIATGVMMNRCQPVAAR